MAYKFAKWEHLTPKSTKNAPILGRSVSKFIVLGVNSCLQAIQKFISNTLIFLTSTAQIVLLHRPNLPISPSSHPSLQSRVLGMELNSV